jgi:methyltransferase (TIGR00027 family)
MREGQPSRTAQTVAFARAIESLRARESRLFEDPYAARFLDRDGLWMLRLLRGALSRRAALYCIDQIGPGLLPYAIARTAFIDEALAAALRRGTPQVVILGAGYDTRALRTPSIETAVVYEVDHPDTQAFKRARLGADIERIQEHVRFVGVDFDRQDLGERLRSAGFRFDRPSFVIWEGVTQYLTEEAVDATLRTLATMNRHSEIVLTYMDRALIEGTRSFPGGRRLLFAVRLIGEPFRFGLAPGEAASFLRKRGFELLEDIGGDEFSERYFAPLDRTDRATETERVTRVRIAVT